MIDERHEELASLYALDLLEGAERTQFEAALDRDPELRQLVRDLRESTAALAHAAPPAAPPAELRRRVLDSIAGPGATRTRANVVHAPAEAFRSPRPAARAFVPWAIAAGFAVAAAWLTHLYFVARADAGVLGQQRQLAEVALQSARNQLEAERLLDQRQLTNTNRELADAQQQLTDVTRAALDNSRKLADAQQALDAARQRAATADRELTDTRARLAALTDDAKHEADLANLKIATLASMLHNSPQALAVAVWSPEKQQGVLTVDQLPPPAADQSYELWVIDARPGAKPVSAGVFSLGAAGKARITFRPTAPIATAATFAISREKKDGETAHAAPAEVVMISK